MQKSSAVIGTALFLAAPATVAGLFPYLISQWVVRPSFFDFLPLQWLGGLLVAAGLAALLDCYFLRFALQGRGTPAPIAPPSKLVVSGLYRWSRNPIYIAILMMIAGQSLIFVNIDLLIYALIACVPIALFVRIYEEPTLRRMFGADYERYCQMTPRWIPLLPS